MHDRRVFALFSSGAQGEYAGLAAIKAYLNSKGEDSRSVSVIVERKSHQTRQNSVGLSEE